MSAIPMNFKITPPKVKPNKGMSLVPLILRTLACVFGPSIVPLIVYLVEGCTNLFWWMLGFGFIISFFLLSFALRISMNIVECGKINDCSAIYRKKLLLIPFHYKNPALKQSSVARKSLCSLPCQILEAPNVPQSATTIVELPISLDSSSSSPFSSEMGGVASQKQFVIFTPTKRRSISAASVSLSPLRNETKAATKTSPFSNRKSGFPRCTTPRILATVSHLSTILESPYAVDCSFDSVQSRRPSCFSS